MEYIFNEENLLKELKEYIDSTYSQHYSKGIQVTEFIQSNLESPDFFKGNVLKYTVRYGRKDGHNRKDILKAMHYLIMMLAYHDKKYKNEGKIITNLNARPFYDESYYASSQPNDVTSANVYVNMGGGKIGQEQNGQVVFVGYGELNENGTLKAGTFRYSTDVDDQRSSQ